MLHSCVASPHRLPQVTLICVWVVSCAVIVGGVTNKEQAAAETDSFNRLDADSNGKVSQAEFTSGRQGATAAAFHCLDGDGKGYVTREEIRAFKEYFYKSPLSQLDQDGLLEWLSRRECVPTDTTQVQQIFKDAGLNGLLLWGYAVRHPWKLKNELEIHPIDVRRTLVHAI